MKKRLIDANAMRDDWLENGENEYVYDTNAVLDSIDSQPTVDAVEVVRCEDCTNYMNDTAYCKKHDKGYCCLDDNIKPKNHYCGYAERKKVDELEEHNA